MLGWLRKRRAYKKGSEFGETLFAEIQASVAAYVVPRLTAGLEVFSDRLATVWDDPTHDPKLIALAELQIYTENLHAALGEFKAMVRIGTYQWDDVMKSLDMPTAIDEFVDRSVSDRAKNSEMVAEKMVELTFDEIDRLTATDSANTSQWRALETLMGANP